MTSSRPLVRVRRGLLTTAALALLLPASVLSQPACDSAVCDQQQCLDD